MLNFHSIIPEFHGVETPNSLKNEIRQMLIFPSFVEGNEPVINLLLLIIEVVFGLDVPEQILKGTNHVSVKSNANHLDQYLVQVLNSRVSFDVSIAN